MVSSNWVPNKKFNATEKEVEYIILYTKGFEKKEVYCKIKYIEKKLLKMFQKEINRFYKNKELCGYWIDNMKYQWRMLALLRDFYDFKCVRDKTHYIRTDDCRRFINCVLDGLKNNKFSNPVKRILSNSTNSYSFIHPNFVQFNQ